MTQEHTGFPISGDLRGFPFPWHQDHQIGYQSIVGYPLALVKTIRKYFVHRTMLLP